jgi:hypothetical protein
MPDSVNSQITDSITQLRKNQRSSLVAEISKAIKDNNLRLISEHLNLLFTNINAQLTQDSLQSRAAIDILTNDEIANAIYDLRMALDALSIKK